jgi:Holliday junction resolvase RusA-like endonuclease
MIINFTVYGKPKALKRHRKRKGGGHYDPSAADKSDFLVMAAQNRPPEPLDQPLDLHITAVFQRPKKHLKDGVLKDNQPFYVTKTPDVDNILKFVCDALNTVFWTDDKVVSQARCLKIYGSQPRIEVTIRTFN